LSIGAYPEASPRDEAAEAQMAAFQEVVGGVRTIRAEWNVPQDGKLEVLVRTSSTTLAELVARKSQAFHALAGTKALQVGEDLTAPQGSARLVLSDAELFVPLAELIDVDAERSRLRKELGEVCADLAKVEKNLTNRAFLERAPAAVIDKERGKQEEFAIKQKRLQANLAALGE
jgi:valyl-tRNA synthetase